MNRGPFILKAGFALLLSLAGLFAARHRPRRRRRAISPPAYPRRPPPPLHLPDLEPVPVPSAGVLDEELPMNQAEEALAKISPPAPVTMADDSVAMEEEIKNLRNLVQCLQERESCLEMKLLEYHGLKEQEVSMRELHNRLQLSATETKLLSLKIESLTAENEKLRAESSDYCRVASELEAQRKKNSVLESKLKSVGEQAKEKMAVLHGRITEIREKEKKELEDSVEVEKKLKLFNKIENDVIELRKENSRLAQEKLAIMKKLESEHILNNPTVIRSPDSVLKSPELGTLEEQNQLREENENLKKKLEQLQTDRCEDVEELVYLRWINACLRYELRHHQPPPGRTVARDLSRCLSPKSEQKAKQLILDYSNSHLNSNRSSSMDFDLDDCFSQTSSEDFDDNSLDSSKTKSSKSSKSKLFNKLKKLVLPKSRNEDKMMPAKTGSDLNSERRASISTCAIDDCNEKWQIKRNHYHDPASSSLDIQNLRRIKQEGDDGGRSERCNSDVGAVYAHKRMLSLDESSIYSGPAEYEGGADPAKEKLKKFAQVFKDSMGSLKHKRLPASLSIS